MQAFRARQHRVSSQAAVIAGPGRAAKRKAILAAATRLFLRAGYGAATMEAIAAEAGVSKQTIYHHFGSKDALFGAIVADLCDSLLASLAPSGHGEGEPRTALIRLGRQVLELALAPDLLALHRLIIAESPRFPELGAATFESGPRLAATRLAGYLREQSQKGALDVGAPELAAEQFFGLILGHKQLRALLRQGEPRPDAADIKHWVERAVEVFLAGYRR